MLNRRSL